MVSTIRDLEDHEETPEEAAQWARKEAAAMANVGASTFVPPRHQDPPHNGTPAAADQGHRRLEEDQQNVDGYFNHRRLRGSRGGRGRTGSAVRALHMGSLTTDLEGKLVYKPPRIISWEPRRSWTPSSKSQRCNNHHNSEGRG